MKSKMKRRFNVLPMIGVMLVSSFQLTAFAQSYDSPSTPATPTETPNAPTTYGGIKTYKGDVGEYLTDSQGKSLYVFDLDSPKQSKCTGECEAVWKPYTVDSEASASAIGGATSSYVGTIKRSNGAIQVTYKDMPLYYFMDDEKSGDIQGNGVSDSGGNWYLVKPDGTKLMPEGAPPTTTPSSTPGPSPRPSGDSSTLNFLDESPNSSGVDNSNYNNSYNRGHHGRHGHNSCGYYNCYNSGWCCNYCSCYYKGSGHHS